MEAYFNGSWYPCQIIRAKEELPKQRKNLWKQKEAKCQQFGKDSHEVVYWFEDDPPAYSVLPRDNTRPISKKSKQAKSDENERQDIGMSQGDKNVITAAIEEESDSESGEATATVRMTDHQDDSIREFEGLFKDGLDGLKAKILEKTKKLIAERDSLKKSLADMKRKFQETGSELERMSKKFKVSEDDGAENEEQEEDDSE